MRLTAAQLGTLQVTDGRMHGGEVCLQELQRAHINLQCVTWFLTTYFSHFKYIYCDSFKHLFFHSLIFCSLSNNRISADGVCALVGALLVNQSLQRLKLE